MAHSFTVRLTDEIDLVRSGITDNGGRFEGNAECGSFEGKTVVGMIKGEYAYLVAREGIAPKYRDLRVALPDTSWRRP